MKKPWIKKPKELKAFNPQRFKPLENFMKKSEREKKKQRYQVQACKDFNLTTKDFTLAIGNNTTTLLYKKAWKDLKISSISTLTRRDIMQISIPNPRKNQTLQKTSSSLSNYHVAS